MRNIASVAFGSCLMLMATSCDDWLALTPENSVPASEYWQTEEEVENAMTGIYCSWINAAGRIFMHGEMRADYLTEGLSLNDAYTNIRECNILSTNTWVAWQNYYTVINNCNLLLERADDVLKKDASFGVTSCNQYKAEATTVRALMYFYLIRTYKDVPYVTWAYYSDDIDRNVAVTSQTTILDDLISQLETIEKEGTLPYSYSSTSVAENKGQVTMYFLKALLADMYRWQGALATDNGKARTAYQKCVDECNAIIASGQYTLIPIVKQLPTEAGVDLTDVEGSDFEKQFYVQTTTAMQDMFEDIYVKGNSNESIFELQIDNYSANPFYSMLISSSRPYMPNVDMLSESVFPSSEKVIGKNYYNDARQTINYLVPNFCWKYAGMDLNGTYYAAASEFDKNILVYRLAEIYLMKAEALVQLAWGDNNTYDQDLLFEAYRAVFKVRDRASAVETTDLLVGTFAMQDIFWDELRNDEPFPAEKIATYNVNLTAPAMEQFVLDEEGREMAFEGRRWFDVLRTAARNSYGKGSCTGGGLNYLLSIVTSATTISKASSVRSRYSNYYECHYLPYPKNDVLTNDLLEQKKDWEMAE